MLLAYHTENYDMKRIYCNHAVEYSNDANLINIGTIKHFLEIKNKIYCVIETYKKKRIEIPLFNLPNVIERYYLIVENSENIEIVSTDKIIRKCIKIEIESELYLTYCVDTDEHD